MELFHEYKNKYFHLVFRILNLAQNGLYKDEIVRIIEKEEYDEIMSLTNPAVKKKLLDSFADGCDSSAVHLKAAAMPRSSWHVLLPITTMKETEVYAPNYRDGDTVVLIRYPHGGRFEIPELTVNNKNKLANQTIRQAKDAIGIHPDVAKRLSGADFDGDAVLVIPNNNKLVKDNLGFENEEKIVTFLKDAKVIKD